MLRESIPDEVRITPRLTFYYMGFDMTQPPLDNRDLRRALSMAVDRRQLTVLIGRGELPAYGYVPTGTSNHVPAPYEWRVLNDAERMAEARAAYAAAGYSDENPLTLSLMFDNGSIHERVAVAVSSMWQDTLGVEIELEKRNAERSEARRSMVGSGDRSAKIRTYNFPQDRVTDHRLEGEYKNHPLHKVVDGNLDEIVRALRTADHAERLANL